MCGLEKRQVQYATLLKYIKTKTNEKMLHKLSFWWDYIVQVKEDIH